MSDLTILLPGIMGSVLTRDGETLWNPGPGMLPRLLRHRAWVQSLMRRQAEDLTSPWIDGVIPGGLVRDLNIVPGLVSIEGYDEAHRAISVLPDIVEGDPLRDQDPIAQTIPDAAALERLIAPLDLNASVPLDSLAYRFDIVLRGGRQTLFENKLEGA